MQNIQNWYWVSWTWVLGCWCLASSCQAAPGSPGLALAADRNWTQECTDLDEDHRQDRSRVLFRIIESWNHRIIGWIRPLRSLSPTMCPTPPCLLNHIPKCHIYKFFLKTSRDGDSTTSLGSLFQCLATLSVNKFLLISYLNLPWRNLRPLPLVLSLVTWEKRPTPPLLQPPFR